MAAPKECGSLYYIYIYSQFKKCWLTHALSNDCNQNQSDAVRITLKFYRIIMIVLLNNWVSVALPKSVLSFVMAFKIETI